MKIAEHGMAALEAQGTILQRRAVRYGRQVAFLLIAGMFALAAFVAVHGLLWAVFLQAAHMTVIGASASVLGVDVLLLLIFGFLGRRSLPGPVEIEARFIRDRHIEAVKQSLTVASVATVLLAGPMGRGFGGILRALFARRR
ncbi:hypothetical protein AA103196_1385 [Ameyamaea chiangmaiensis NBRC 103196]|uniref:Phage holin family protein n=1 Tax=Ameyamaea chiangmaiensis TaxID=442969 RepID=A0A850PGP8_9PROT|nr:hypothetical protein [Ameyamaea chiangmaiensis]MBS4075207.1 hypothetical protein [Ameyamaea chiangmaiensis]NVN41829.1 hypothetical protein [Ameyamaea chiangmaiensis]GBQ66403.1 hypothetical protein AA103196_1385 [Ameyamaea chiangmaiensis NBRC 103196]